MNKRLLLATALAGATLLAACRKDDAIPEPLQSQSEEQLDAVMGVVDENKTFIDENNTILWGKNESAILYYKRRQTDRFSTSTATSAYDGKTTAQFSFTISSGGGGSSSYTLGGVYPASASTGDNTVGSNFKVVLPSSQTVGADGAYDPAAYIMIAKPVTTSSKPTSVSFALHRATALNKLTLKNMPEAISSVEISAPGKNLAGGRSLNLTTGKNGSIYSGEEAIKIKFASPMKAGDISFYFVSWDAKLAAGETLTIKAKGTEHQYSRTITAGAAGINFYEAMLNKLSINFATAESTEIDAEELSDEEILAMVRTDVPNTAFYKDAFLDGGVNLNPGVKVDGAVSNGALPAALSYIGFTSEYFLSRVDDPFATANSTDKTLQTEIMCGTTTDSNGVLLYPDGEPRFRMLYIFGGSSGNHGTSLGETGRERVRTFYKNGGTYAGSCAGAYLAGKYASGSALNYFNIWTGGNMIGTGLSNSSTGAKIVSGSPLLKYYNFGGDLFVANVRHNGGGYMDTNGAPAGTEILARFGTSPSGSTSASYYDKPLIWAYKASEQTGRLCVCGSHPEDGMEGELRDLTAAIFRYAYDGVGCAKVKGVLRNGSSRSMTKTTGDNAPAYTAIGDKQCHHFAIYLPKAVSSLKLDLQGSGSYDLELYLKKGSFAFPGSSPEFSNTASGSSKTLTATNLEAGLWYVTVRCNTTVKAALTNTNTSTGKGWKFTYSGSTGVLNGVPYTIKATW
ncbi:MAG: hypothetical protein IJU69_05430 [Bacteroidales bacterium]|nr:hypothetical protein [Bacteroidales bacterium]